MNTLKKVAILVGGGPAPGINCVIGTATIRCELAGVEVLGVPSGFADIMAGGTDTVRRLSIDDVSRVHFRGGSILGTSRANPTKDSAAMNRAVGALLELGVDGLITIGGDDTAFSAMKLAEAAAGRIKVVHVPKTIDNDLVLPPNIDTFGFQTARHLGAQIIENLMVDAATTSRWYVVVAMGRKAGHLALGIGKSVGATLTLIPEEFPDEKLPLATLADILVGAVLKRIAHGRRHGVAVVAEGVALAIDPADLEDLIGAERDEHGHVRIAEIEIGRVLKDAVQERLAELGHKVTLVSKDIGYELRSADPIPADMEYTRDLGFCAAQHLLDGGSDAMVTIQGGQFVAVPFSEMIDPKTGRTAVRLVDVNSARYRIARSYMIRLAAADFSDSGRLSELAAVAGLTPEAFRERFEPLVANDSKEAVLA
ncbi:MAG: 6-phosphofructokinase [Candidatus Binatia bacterium]|jgi:6-phosphofructokinase